MTRKILRRLCRPFGRFAAREEGTIMAEGLIILPLLVWAFIGLFVYWDAFREMNTVQKAAYTLSDVLSRQRTGVNNAYVTGMKQLFDYLVGDSQKTNVIRVTSVTRNAVSKKFEVHWSRTSNAVAMPALTTATLQDYQAQIPTMSDNDYAVIVEVRVPYYPIFDVGLGDLKFTEFIVTRPRFRCIPMDNVPCPIT